MARICPPREWIETMPTVLFANTYLNDLLSGNKLSREGWKAEFHSTGITRVVFDTKTIVVTDETVGGSFVNFSDTVKDMVAQAIVGDSAHGLNWCKVARNLGMYNGMVSKIYSDSNRSETVNRRRGLDAIVLAGATVITIDFS